MVDQFVLLVYGIYALAAILYLGMAVGVLIFFLLLIGLVRYARS